VTGGTRWKDDHSLEIKGEDSIIGGALSQENGEKTSSKGRWEEEKKERKKGAWEKKMASVALEGALSKNVSLL